MDIKSISLLILIYFICSTQFLYFYSKDNNNPAWDESWHALISLNIYNQLFHKTELTTKDIENTYPALYFADKSYPFFFPLAAIPFYILLGVNFHIALLSNLILLIILILSTFFLGKKIKGDNTGLLAAFIVSSTLQYNFLMRQYLPDICLTSMVTLGYLLLISSNNFQNLSYTILFGIISGFGMLTNWIYSIYLIFPVYFSLSVFFKKKNWIKNYYKITIPFIIIIVLLVLWYSPQKIQNLINPVVDNTRRNPIILSWESFFFYFVPLINGYSLFYFFLFVFSLIIWFRIKRKDKFIKLIFLNFVIVYIIFSLIPYKDISNIVPLFVSFALITASGLMNLKTRNLIIFIGLIILIGVSQVFIFNFGLLKTNLSVGNIMIFPDKGRLPLKSSYNISKYLSTIGKQNKFTLCIIADTEQLNDVNIPFYTMNEKYPIDYIIGNGCNPLLFNFVLIGPIDQTWRTAEFEKSKNILNTHMEQFNMIYSTDNVTIYKNKFR